jgi:predicted ester cyclase
MSIEAYKILARKKYENLKQRDIDKSLTLYPAFSHFEVRVERQVAEGNQVASYWVMRGKHTGEYLGIPPSGRDVMLSGMAIDMINEGKLTEVCSVMDFDGFLQRLKCA